MLNSLITSSLTPLLTKKILLVFQKQTFLTTFQFPLFLWNTDLIPAIKNNNKKRVINADSMQEFRDILSEVDWENVYSISNPNDVLKYFLEVFFGSKNMTISYS